MEPSWLQILLGTLILMAAFFVIAAPNPVVSAISLMSTLFLTGAMYFSLGFFFIGSVQILIYAGAISVLFVFIVMLLDLKPHKVSIPGRKITLTLSFFAAVLLLVAMIPAVIPALGVSPSALASAEMAQNASTPEATGALVSPSSAITISLQFLSKYMIPFQATGFLILAAVMGVAVLGKKNAQGGEV